MNRHTSSHRRSASASCRYRYRSQYASPMNADVTTVGVFRGIRTLLRQSNGYPQPIPPPISIRFSSSHSKHWSAAGSPRTVRCRPSTRSRSRNAAANSPIPLAFTRRRAPTIRRTVARKQFLHPAKQRVRHSLGNALSCHGPEANWLIPNVVWVPSLPSIAVEPHDKAVDVRPEKPLR